MYFESMYRRTISKGSNGNNLKGLDLMEVTQDRIIWFCFTETETDLQVLNKKELPELLNYSSW